MKNIFSRNNGKSTKSLTTVMENAIKAAHETEPEPKPEPKEEWIWVNGYKGTDKDMKCRDFQYEIGGAYHIDDGEEVEECKNGFHLCLNLQDVFDYYSLGNGYRYFKVKALVRKKDYERYCETKNYTYTTAAGYAYTMLNPWARVQDKLVAKEIIFLEEVDTHELYDEIRKRYDDLKDAPDDIVKRALCEDVDKVCNACRVKILVNDGYSEAFAHYMVTNGKFDMAHMLAAEKDLSMDVRVLSIMMN